MRLSTISDIGMARQALRSAVNHPELRADIAHKICVEIPGSVADVSWKINDNRRRMTADLKTMALRHLRLERDS